MRLPSFDYISISQIRKRGLSTKAKTMVQSSQRADFVRNSRAYNRSTTKIHDVVIRPMSTPMIIPVLFSFPLGGGGSWLVMSSVFTLVIVQIMTIQVRENAGHQEEWRHVMFSLKAAHTAYCLYGHIACESLSPKMAQSLSFLSLIEQIVYNNWWYHNTWHFCSLFLLAIHTLLRDH